MGLLIALLVGIPIIIAIFKILLLGGFIVFSFILILIALILLPHYRNYTLLKKVSKTLQDATLSLTLDTLNYSEKKELASLIDVYLNNREEFKKQVINSLFYGALGYTIADTGSNKTIKYVVGYSLLNKLLRKHAYKYISKNLTK